MIPLGPFWLDDERQRLLFGDVERPLRAKSFAVLRELARRRGRLVTKEELFGACWPKTAVSQTVLRVCISEIRAALGVNDAGSPSIEYVGRRGYRLIADVDALPQADTPVGRSRELRFLGRALSRAGRGQRQTVFLTGDAGLGKTTLLEHFVEDTRTTSRTCIGWGQCVELTAGSEPYLPIFDLLGRLSAEDISDRIPEVLERWAPTWLMQMPAVGAKPTGATSRLGSVPNRERMLRELGEAIDALAADEPLVLVIEDLHWTDLASADALAYLAQRTTPARLLVIASCRPGDLAGGGHQQALRQRLMANRRATELALSPWTIGDVGDYLRRSLTESPIQPTLVRTIHARTKGNPLFVIATIEYLLEHGLLSARRGRWELEQPLDGIVPEGLRQLVRRQVDRLDPGDRRLLDAASVAGAEFAVVSVAAGLGKDVTAVDDDCANLALRSELISAIGVSVWPDRTVSGRYEFRHAIYRDVLEEAIAPVRRQHLHGAIGERLERGWGEQSAEIAAELAIHFARAADDERAVRYRAAAAKRARSRFAETEAVEHLRGALDHLTRRPATPERFTMELSCLHELGSALVGLRGPASEEALTVFTRVRELAERLQAVEVQLGAQTAICSGLALRAEFGPAREAAEALLSAAERAPSSPWVPVGHVSLGYVLFQLAEFRAARRHFVAAHELSRPETHPIAAILWRSMLAFDALVCEENAAMGDRWIQDSVAFGEGTSVPHYRSYAHQLAAQYYATARQRERARQHAATTLAIAGEFGYVTHETVAAIVDGWARGDAAAIRHGLVRYEGAEQFASTSLFRALLVETLLESGDLAAVPAELAAAFAFTERSGERRHLAELYRLRGEWARRQSDSPCGDATDAFQRARALAHEQGSRLFESRAAVGMTLT